MLDNQLLNRLESFFEELDQHESQLMPDGEPALAGWTFSLDEEGRYSNCSDEVGDILGYEPEAFFGNPIASFAVSPEAKPIVESSLGVQTGPQELNLTFQTLNGDPVPVRLHLFKPPNDNGQNPGWHGFVQVLQADAPVQPEEVSIPSHALETLVETIPEDSTIEEARTDDEALAEPGPVVDAQAGFEGSEGTLPSADGDSAARPDTSQSTIILEPPVERTEPPLPKPPKRSRKSHKPLASTDTRPDYREYRGTGALRLGHSLATPGSPDRPATLTVPVTLADRSSGILEITDPTPHRSWSEDDRRLVEEIADQLSLALDNASLFQAEQRRARELGILHEVSLELAQEQRDLEAALGLITQRAMQLLSADSAATWLWKENERQLELGVVFRSGTQELVGTRAPSSQLEDESKLALTALQKREIRVVEDLSIWSGKTVPSGSPRIYHAMAVPLIWQSEGIGVLVFTRNKPDHPFSPNEQHLAELLAGQAGAVIQNAGLFAQTQARAEELAVLNLVTSSVNRSLDLDEILDDALGQILAVTGFEACLVSNAAPRKPALTLMRQLNLPEPAKAFLEENGIGPGTPCMVTFTKAETTVYANLLALKEGDLAEIPFDVDLLLNLGFISYAGTPLISKSRILGTLCLFGTKPYQASRRVEELLSAIGQQIGIAMDNAQLYRDTERKALQLQTAAEIARDASETLATDQLLNRAVNLVKERFGFYHASIFLIDENGENAIVRASTGEAGEEMVLGGHQHPVGSKSVVGYVTQTGPLVVNDVTKDPVHKPNPLLPDTRAELGIPMKIGDRVIGALDVQSTDINAFNPDDVAVLQTLADQIAVAVDNARTYELAQQAFEDAQQRLEELTMLYDVSQSLASAPLEMEEITTIIARQFVKVLGVPECAVSRLEDDGETLTTLVDIRIDRTRELINLERVGLQQAVSDYRVIERVLESLTPKILKSADQGSHPSDLTILESGEISTLILIPLASKGQPIGLIELRSREPDFHTSPEIISLAMTLANQAAVALENARLYEDQLRTAQQLRELDQLKSQFLANMSHELRTPLNSIIGFSRVILKEIDGPVTALQQQDLTAIYNAGQHLLGLINDILDLSKIEAGKMELSFEPINLNELIESVLAAATGLIKHKPIQIEKHITPDLPATYADPMRIRQVLFNLFSNAAKFTDEGVITVTADTEDDRRGNPIIVFSVSDTGPGISKEDQGKLFQPFSQVDASPTRRTGGSGLGLSISKRLIELHGGKIGLKSDVGRGSTFYFRLPVSHDAPPEALDIAFHAPIAAVLSGEPAEVPMVATTATNDTVQLPQIEMTESAATPATENNVVLAIDDDSQVTGLYERYLNSHGYDLVPLTDPSRALEKARQIKPFAITIDVLLSDHDAWKIIEELKLDPETETIPIIICSIIDDQEKASSLGVRDYLVKPIIEEDLVDAVNRLKEPQAKPEILIVDHDPADLRLLQMLLKGHERYAIRVAENGRDALESILSSRPLAMILGHSLPDIDGIALLHTLESTPGLQDIPTIYLIGQDPSEQETRTLQQLGVTIQRKDQLNEQDLWSKIQAAIAPD